MLLKFYLLGHTWYTLPTYSVRRKRPLAGRLHHRDRSAARLRLDPQTECPYHQAHCWALVEARSAHLRGAFDFRDSRYLHRFSKHYDRFCGSLLNTVLGVDHCFSPSNFSNTGSPFCNGGNLRTSCRRSYVCRFFCTLVGVSDVPISVLTWRQLFSHNGQSCGELTTH